MSDRLGRLSQQVVSGARTALFGPQILAFVPAMTLGGHWYGGEGATVVMALILPAAMGLLVLLTPRPPAGDGPRDGVTGLPLAAAAATALDRAFASEASTGCRTAALLLEIDDLDAVRTRFGEQVADTVLADCVERLAPALREGDLLTRHDPAHFAVALAPVRRIDLEAMIQLAARLQKALEEPVRIGRHQLHLTASVGFCLPRRTRERNGAACLDAALQALAEARGCGPGAIRSFVPRPASRIRPSAGLGDEVAEAMEAGRVMPWFQPQICTDTGEVSGMEALARWVDPDRGVVLPGAFLPAVAANGLQQRLNELMCEGALAALSGWDAAGLEVPSVAVNFGSEELADPKLADRVMWELDRAGVAPGRLAVEVLETVIADSEDDSVARTLARLAAAGCRIDLDDFGTGSAAIANIRRFSVSRIKIDRSFVARIDTDPEQQTLVTAILELAQRLELETLAEGVETVGEHALLAQLGCGHVQGYSIGRPMPFDETLTWLRRHRQRQEDAAWPDRQTG